MLKDFFFHIYYLNNGNAQKNHEITLSSTNYLSQKLVSVAITQHSTVVTTAVFMKKAKYIHKINM